MSGSGVPHHLDRGKTVFQAVVEAADKHGRGRIAVEDPLAGELSAKRLLVGARVLGQRLMGFAEEPDDRRHAAQRERRGGDDRRADLGEGAFRR
jgi:hypothetical protein